MRKVRKMSTYPSAACTPWTDTASTISFQDLADILNSLDWESMNFGDNSDEQQPVSSDDNGRQLTAHALSSLSVSNSSFTPGKTTTTQQDALLAVKSETLTPTTPLHPAGDVSFGNGTAETPVSSSKQNSATKREKTAEVTPSGGSNLLHRQLYMRTAPLLHEVLSYVQGQHQLILPRLTDAPHILRDIDIIDHSALQLLCTRGSPEYVAFIQMLEAISDANVGNRDSSIPVKEKKKFSKAKFFEHLYYVVPVHSSNAKKEDRHARNAIRLLLAGLALAEMHQTSYIGSSSHQQLLQEFLHYHERWVAAHPDIWSASSDITDSTLLRIFVLFREVFQIIPLRNNLELCMLLLSVVEAAGVHRQRGGHMTKADNLYRDVLESIATAMNVI